MPTTIQGLGFPSQEYRFGGPHNKDYSILVSISGFPYFGQLLYRDVYYTYTRKMDQLGLGLGFKVLGFQFRI